LRQLAGAQDRSDVFIGRLLARHFKERKQCFLGDRGRYFAYRLALYFDHG
jgi:hypothetical protein